MTSSWTWYCLTCPFTTVLNNVTDPSQGLMTHQKDNLQSRCVSLTTTSGNHEQANALGRETMLMGCMWSERRLSNSGKLKVNSFLQDFFQGLLFMD